MAADSEALASALSYLKAGELTQAERIYRESLQIDPNQAAAMHGLSGIAYQTGEYEAAIHWITKALAIQDTNAVFHSNLGAAYRATGRLEEAVACYHRALRLRPDFAEAHNNLGNVLELRGRLKEAVARYRLAILIRPDCAEAAKNLSVALLEQERGRGEETAPRDAPRGSPKADKAKALHELAIACGQQGNLGLVVVHCQEALQLDPNLAEVYVTQGVALGKQGKLDEAVTAFLHALRVNPDYVEAYVDLGAALREQGKLDRSVAFLQHAIRLKPKLADAHNKLGLAYFEQGKLDEAEQSYREALRLKPDFALAMSHLGNLLEEMGQADAGCCLIESALNLAPDDFQVRTHFGIALVNQGKFDEAKAHFLKAVAIKPSFSPALFFLARDGNYHFTDEELTRIKELLQQDSLPLRDRINLHFALARGLDRSKDFDDAFRQCQQGNLNKSMLLRLQGNPFQSDAHAQFIMRLIATFQEAYFEQVRTFGSDGALPVFIVGMPRSGTSLVEQILASHPAVFGAGEIRNLKQLVAGLPAELGNSTDYPECLNQLNKEASALLSERYIRGLRRLGGERLRVTDKVPMNFHHLGLIATLFPGAQVIHCRRDPRDVCWSCYFQNFREVPFSCDLRVLGEYYRRYERLMAHWKKVLPLPILDVCYEELVEDVEKVSREMIAFCRLPWHDSCLAFHKTQRSVRTASNMQVRQPTYRSSKGYWKNYASHLGPLLEALTGP
jgi:tetratricopeptide (TPR) repeat protein